MVGEGVLTQIGRWIAYPFQNEIPLAEMAISVLIIIMAVWFLSDGANWVKTEVPEL